MAMRVFFAALLALGLSRSTAYADSPPAYGYVAPWRNPAVLNDPARREVYEYTDMFDHRRAKPAWTLRVFQQHPEARLHPEKLPSNVLLGDMLFHAPALLGPHAAFFGMSCASCHPNGSATVDIDLGTENELPGTVDMTSQYFTPLADDGINNPRNIPSLRGARYTGPYGHAGAVGSIGDFIDHVIALELGQPPIRRDWRDALTMYVEQIDFLPNPQLDALGRLTDKASAAAHRGEALFNTPRAAYDGMSCASCHVPESFFTDRRSHVLHHGKGLASDGEAFDTPTLLNLVETPPYFYDGSAPTLRAAVNGISARNKLGLTDAEKADLTAYLEAVGAADPAPAEPSVVEQVGHPLAYLSLLLSGPLDDDAQLWPLCLETVRHELHGALRTLAPGPKAILEPSIRAFEEHVAKPSVRTPTTANRAALARLRDRIARALDKASAGAPVAEKREP